MAAPDPPSYLRALLTELREYWWIYVLAPVAVTLLNPDRAAAIEVTLLVNACATVCIGVSSQAAFLLGERRGWALPFGLHNPALLLLGVAVGTELSLLLLATFAEFDAATVRRGLWLVGGTVAALVATVSITYEGLQLRTRAVELRAEQARRQAVEAKLDALLARMNPHFLFNSLNTVANLIEEDREAAVIAVEQLAELLRYTLEHGADSLVPLADELACARGYLELERARFGDRMRVELAIEPGVDALPVPPLVLQPLIENAVKHAVATSRAPVAIAVEIRREGAGLRLEVCDDGPGASDHRGTGTAHAGLRERLRLLYGERARFEAGPRAERGYRACVLMPVPVPDPTPSPASIGPISTPSREAQP